jgi:hypothetical protein
MSCGCLIVLAQREEIKPPILPYIGFEVHGRIPNPN